ncbi:MAG: hypothetical protein M0T84_00175 [Betaproteobacteria bacterium]|nr:hypothetical protein [Betaproteobacteria bacterium]
MNIGKDQIQLTLDLEMGLTDRYRSTKEVVAAGVYRRGLKRTAADLDVAPGNLSVQLSGDGQRHFDLDQLDRYIEITGDKTPIYYLLAKHCHDQSGEREEALGRVEEILRDLTAAVADAGIAKKKTKKA